MRQLVLRIDPKMVETMLALAQGEHATALHNMQEEAGEEAAAGVPAGAGGPDKGDEGGPSRRGKREPRE